MWEKYPRGGETISTIRVKFTLTIILMSMFLLSSLVLPIGSSNAGTRATSIDGPQWETFKSNSNRSGKCGYDLENNMGEILWKKWLSPVLDSSPAIGSDGTIYIGSRDLYLYAVSPDGTIEWDFMVNDEIRSSPTLDRDGFIYFGCLDGTVYSLYSNGKHRWSKILNSSVYSSPLVVPGYGLCVTTEDGRLVYLDSKDGDILWQFETDGPIYSSPTLSSNGNILITSRDGYLYSVNSSSGLEWKYNSGGPSNSTPALYQGSRIYFTSDDQGIHCVDHYGARIWRYPTWDTGWCSPAVMGHEQVFYGTGLAEMVCLGTTGGVRWTFKAMESVVTSPVISKDGRIVFGCKGGILQCITDMGSPVWSTSIDGENACTPAMDNEGNIYVADQDGFLYKIGTRPRTRPSPPRNLRIESGDLFCKLDWDEPEENGNLPLEGYTVIRKDQSTDATTIVGSTLPEIRTLTDLLVEPRNTYSYYVTAFNSIGDSDPSQMVDGKPFRIPKVPGMPIGLRSEVTDTTVTISWTGPGDHGTSPIIGYHVRRYDTNSGLNGEGYVYENETEFTSQVPWMSYYYYFTVAAINDVGEGPESERERVFVPDEEIVIFNPPSNNQREGSGISSDLTGFICCLIVMIVTVGIPIVIIVLISKSVKNSGEKSPPHMIWRDRKTGKWTTVPPPKPIPVEVRPGHNDRGRGRPGFMRGHTGMQTMSRKMEMGRRTGPPIGSLSTSPMKKKKTGSISTSVTKTVGSKTKPKVDRSKQIRIDVSEDDATGGKNIIERDLNAKKTIDEPVLPELDRPRSLTADEKDDFIVDRIIELQGMLKDGEIDHDIYNRLKRRLMDQLED